MNIFDKFVVPTEVTSMKSCFIIDAPNDDSVIVSFYQVFIMGRNFANSFDQSLRYDQVMKSGNYAHITRALR